MSGCKTGTMTDVMEKIDQLEACIERTCAFVNGGPDDTVQLGDGGESQTPTLRNLARQVKSAIAQFCEDMRSYMDPVYLNSYAYNTRRTACVDASIPSGSTITLPVWYFPKRDILFWSVDGVICTPKKPDGQDCGAYQYEEVGDDPNSLSNEVKIHFPIEAGMYIDAWVVASNLIKEVARIEAAVAQACACAGEAADSASMSMTQAARADAEADRAEAAAEVMPDISTALDGQTIVARGVEGQMIARFEFPSSAPVSSPVVRQHKALLSDLSAGTAYAVPAYAVGSGKLSIFMYGILCEPGGSQDTATYMETGEIGDVATEITFFDNLSAGTEITAILAT